MNVTSEHRDHFIRPSEVVMKEGPIIPVKSTVRKGLPSALLFNHGPDMFSTEEVGQLQRSEGWCKLNYLFEGPFLCRRAGQAA